MGMYLSLVSGAIKLLNTVAAALQKHHDEQVGATAQRERTEADTLATLDRVSAPGTDAAVEQLWDSNKGKFGNAVGEGR